MPANLSHTPNVPESTENYVVLNTYLIRFWAVFDQICDNTAAALRVDLSVRSSGFSPTTNPAKV